MIPLSWDEVYFGHPWAFALVGLVLLAPALFALLDRTLDVQDPEAEFVSEHMRQILLDDGIEKARLSSWALWTLWFSGLFLSLALTRPQWGLLEQSVEQKGLDIVICMDLSNSMRATDLSPSRIDNARRELAFLVDELQGNRVGLVGFAGSAFLFCPLTLDTDAVELFLDEMTVEAVPVPGTSLGEAVKVALNTFEMANLDSSGSKVILLLTDGEDHESKPLEWAKKAAEMDITIDTIGIGTTEGSVIPDPYGGLIKDESGTEVVSKLDGSVLQEMAKNTGGFFLRLDNSSGLDGYLKNIRKRQMRDFGSKTEVRRQERFLMFAGLAAFFFFLTLVFEEVDKRR